MFLKDLCKQLSVVKFNIKADISTIFELTLPSQTVKMVHIKKKELIFDYKFL